MDSRTARVNHHRGAKDQLCVSQMFTWGHVAQLDRVFDESIRRSWAAGAEPGQGPVTLDVDSTICETYGLKKGSSGIDVGDHTGLNRSFSVQGKGCGRSLTVR